MQDKEAYESPELVELAGIAELTLGGPPSSGLDTNQCNAGRAQMPPPHCVGN